MWKQLCSWILYKKLGWTKNVTVAHPDKYIICLAPHTSNWDFVLGQLYSGAEGWKINFLMKKEWFFWPLGILFRHLGGIPVWRTKRTSMTDNLAEEARRSKSFKLCITPEATRSANPDWKKGFLFISKKAGIPILAIMLFPLHFNLWLHDCFCFRNGAAAGNHFVKSPLLIRYPLTEGDRGFKYVLIITA